MRDRLLSLDKTYAVLLFGARGTGKSTLLHALFPKAQTAWINLLDPEEEALYSARPNTLTALVEGLPVDILFVVIDEIQKIPKLLDLVHHLIESTDKIFILTGSSARKLKHGGANLLAGRAFVENLYPFSFLELQQDFNLLQALQFGMLPKIWELQNDTSKSKFLQTYAHVYIKEEVWGEQLVRKIDPFRKFLEVAAQCDGKEVNFQNISRDTGVDPKTIQNYYTILEDTLLGFYLEAHQNSFRKRLAKTPKFFFFDVGVSRGLSRMLDVFPSAKTSYYGELFERFVIIECYKLAHYFYPNYRLCYLKTHEGKEIDLVVDRPGKPLLLIEIKSAEHINEDHVSSLQKIQAEIPAAEAVCFSLDVIEKKYGEVSVLPWNVGIKRYFAK